MDVVLTTRGCSDIVVGGWGGVTLDEATKLFLDECVKHFDFDSIIITQRNGSNYVKLPFDTEKLWEILPKFANIGDVHGDPANYYILSERQELPKGEYLITGEYFD